MKDWKESFLIKYSKILLRELEQNKFKNVPYFSIKATVENKLGLPLRKYGKFEKLKLNEISSCKRNEVEDIWTSNYS